MSYIGVPPVSGDFVVLDAITTSATASYTLQRSSVNFAPESANNMLVSLNGTIQKPNSSFTVSGSTITFSSALTSSDAIDFILVLGNVNAVGVATTVADDAITDAKTNFVSTSSTAGLQIRGDGTTDGTLQLNCSQNSHGIKLKSPAHSAGQSYTLTFPTSAPSADTFLKTDGSGNLSFASAGGNTPIFSAHLDANQSLSNATSTKLTMTSESIDTDGAYDTTNSKFTVPSGKAGKYLIHGKFRASSFTGTLDADIYKNGSNSGIQFRTENYSAGNNFGTVAVIAILDLAESDYIELYGIQISSYSSANITSKLLQGFKLG